jgi:hypothetical protein
MEEDDRSSAGRHGDEIARKGPRPFGAAGQSPILDHEFPIPRDYEPCGKYDYDMRRTCPDTSRYIRFVPGNSGKKMVCGEGHGHDFDGGLFIAAHHFEEGAEFAGVLPPDLTPSVEKCNQTRWKISKTTQAFLDSRSKCAHCAVPPFDSWNNPDSARLLEWLAAHYSDLHEEVHAELRGRPGALLRDWWFESSIELRTKIRERASMSLLSTDHAVPRKIGNRVWPRLTAEAREFLRSSLVFRLCRFHNLSKGAKLPLEQDIVDLYINERFDGDAVAAKADVRRWTLLQEILEVVYEKKAG